jgi:DNA primase
MSVSNEFWKKRINNIKQSVRLRSLVDYFNVPCQSSGDVTQIHCPFHGYDAHASARIYDTNSMYCWVCNKTWDVVEFVKDFKNIKFKEAVVLLEELYFYL